MSSQEQEDTKVRKDLQRLGKFLDHQLPFGWGFVFLAFPFGEGGRMNYIANAERADVIRSMYEFIEATREKWAQDQPELGAAAEDEQLARARQELSELKRLLVRAADALETLLLGINAVYICTDTAIQEDSEKLMECVSAYEPLIAELRKAAE